MPSSRYRMTGEGALRTSRIVIVPGGASAGRHHRGGGDATRHVPTARKGRAVGYVRSARPNAGHSDYERVNLAQIVHNDADRVASLEK